MAKNYYFTVFTASTWEIFSSLSPPRLGFTENAIKRAKSLKPGDVCFAYVTGIMRITGAYEVVSNVTVAGGTSVWGSTKFPACVEVKPLVVFDLGDAPAFLSLAHTQSWYQKLGKKKYWSFAFRNSPRPVKDADALSLLDALQELHEVAKAS